MYGKILFILIINLFLIFQYIKEYNSIIKMVSLAKNNNRLKIFLCLMIFLDCCCIFLSLNYEEIFFALTFLFMGLFDLFTCEIPLIYIIPVLCIGAYFTIANNNWITFLVAIILLIIVYIFFSEKIGLGDILVILFFILRYGYLYAFVCLALSSIVATIVFCILLLNNRRKINSNIPFVFYMALIFIIDLFFKGAIVWEIVDYYSFFLTVI